MAKGAAMPVTVVRGVRTETAGGITRIYVDADGALKFKDFTLKGPDRIVVDLARVRSGSGSKSFGVASGLVKRVRIGEPSAGTVRIVIDVREPTRYQVVDNGASLIIIIG
jgi:N-acetylmuramoyl-L-alanine amidase